MPLNAEQRILSSEKVATAKKKGLAEAHKLDFADEDILALGLSRQ